jgi:hypothetical protein
MMLENKVRPAWTGEYGSTETLIVTLAMGGEQAESSKNR